MRAAGAGDMPAARREAGPARSRASRNLSTVVMAGPSGRGSSGATHGRGAARRDNWSTAANSPVALRATRPSAMASDRSRNRRAASEVIAGDRRRRLRSGGCMPIGAAPAAAAPSRGGFW